MKYSPRVAAKLSHKPSHLPPSQKAGGGKKKLRFLKKVLDKKVARVY